MLLEILVSKRESKISNNTTDTNMSPPREPAVTVDDALLAAHLTAPASDRPALVGAIDQGTSSSRFLVVTAAGRVLASAQVEFDQVFPPGRPGWHEHDPFAIWDSVAACADAATAALGRRGLEDWTPDVVGITNQRETVACWNARSGRVYHNAIVWDDARTGPVAAKIVEECGGDADVLRAVTGLPIASYFAGTRVRWLIDHCPRLKKDLMSPAERRYVRFGTIDTWLVYMLTGRPRDANPDGAGRAAHAGGVHATDVTNASRWLFMDLETLEWDEGLVTFVCGGSGVTVPAATALPRIYPSSDTDIGTVSGEALPCLAGATIGAILGDQHAALFGQACFSPGEVSVRCLSLCLADHGLAPARQQFALADSQGWSGRSLLPSYLSTCNY